MILINKPMETVSILLSVTNATGKKYWWPQQRYHGFIPLHAYVCSKISFVLGGNTFYIQIILVSLIVNSLASFIKWLGLSRGLDQIFFGNKKKVITFLSSRLCWTYILVHKFFLYWHFNSKCRRQGDSSE